MTDILYWFMFWKQPKSLPQALFQGLIAGMCVLSPFWVGLLVVSHG